MSEYLSELKKAYAEFQRMEIDHTEGSMQKRRNLANRLMTSVPYLLGQIEAYEKVLSENVLEFVKKEFVEPTE